MRTTLTLDPDVAADLQRLQRERRASWKQVVNDTLRAGARAMGSSRRPQAQPLQTVAVKLGRPKVPDISNVHDVLSALEGETRS